MPETAARRLASRLRNFIGDRRHARRINVRLPVTVSLATSLVGTNGFRRRASLTAHTIDVSLTGLALVVPAIRVGEHYLTGDDRVLWLNLQLPAGSVDMQVAPVRYEHLDEHETETGFLLGVHITEINSDVRTVFNNYIKRLRKSNEIH